jgi:hypothetical protein
VWPPYPEIRLPEVWAPRLYILQGGRKMIRWYVDLAIVGRTIVGKVHQLTVEGKSAPGQVRQVGKWHAIGMRATWADTELGTEHATRNEAMLAVAKWYEANEGKATT